MKRRDFLAAASSMVLPLTVNGLGLKAYNENSKLVQSALATNSLEQDKILVIIYLNGGNDGLNTVIPIEYYSEYFNLRSNIAIPENRVLPLEGNLETGLHPSMDGMRNLYNDGKLAIVHSVSYPNPDLSHPRSTEILMTGVDSNQYSRSGWAGRYLQDRFKTYPDGYPNDQMRDPLAIQIGYIDTPTLFGNDQPMNVAIQDPQRFYSLLGNIGEVSETNLPCCDAGDMISFIRQQQVLSVGYSNEIKSAADKGTNLGAYPAASLAQQLKIVARLIHGGLQTKIYYVEMGGFDTHATQVGTTSLEGVHATLLKNLSDSIAAFQNDLILQGNENKVIGMTFSEFGRRANSNASKGTDHGVAAPMFVFGSGVKRQVVGTNPNLVSDLLPPIVPWDKNQNVKMQIDFRRVYGDILNDWFGNSQSSTNSILFKEFDTISLFSETVESVSSGFWPDRNIWSTGRPPGVNDYVKINNGHQINLGQNVTVKNIYVGSGAELSLMGNYKISTTG
ncbi:hypothetical protein DSL64_09605 [Dyadobacter luteus]|uniref:DUF1501 domain-containing protein n=1 Tax=Dyadobacter luteus TaxID=2259619 RepID=A0A3D8YDF0_9BACT|nr:DUF1501 domain-containing protein [Dyadobacter luteus]REA62494.1 hypothetical protein DSL64_09605 [Dyadobacter luteus]